MYQARAFAEANLASNLNGWALSMLRLRVAGSSCKYHADAPAPPPLPLFPSSSTSPPFLSPLLTCPLILFPPLLRRRAYPCVRAQSHSRACAHCPAPLALYTHARACTHHTLPAASSPRSGTGTRSRSQSRPGPGGTTGTTASRSWSPGASPSQPRSLSTSPLASWSRTSTTSNSGSRSTSRSRYVVGVGGCGLQENKTHTGLGKGKGGTSRCCDCGHDLCLSTGGSSDQGVVARCA